MAKPSLSGRWVPLSPASVGKQLASGWQAIGKLLATGALASNWQAMVS